MSALDLGLSASPYPGLRPFRRDEADIFFGREEQVDRLLARLESNRFLAVVGSSGCGKSSLVRAGMLSALEGGFMASAGARWRVAEMRPGARPLANLAAAVQECGLLDAAWRERDEARGFLLAALSRGPLGLADLLSEPLAPKSDNLLLLVDQFEELFRFHRDGDEKEAAAFVDLLLASSRQQAAPIYVVLTMRSDFLGDCSLFEDLPEAINDAQYLIPRMTREQCRAAIVGPAAAFGASVEPALTDRILGELGADPDQLPLMQHALMRVWNRASGRDPSDGIVLTVADYESIGGLRDALSNHADELFETLDEQQQRIAEHLMRALSERGADQRDTRRPVSLASAAETIQAAPAEVARVADLFRKPDCSFLTPPLAIDLDPTTVLDISHEALIRQWRRMSDWVQAEADSAAIFRRLAETARLWKDGRAAPWTTPDLENAIAWRTREQPTAAWAQRYGGGFGWSMLFLDASEALQEKSQEEEEQRRQRELELLQNAADAERRRADEANNRELAQQVANRRLKLQTRVAAVACLAAIVLAGAALFLLGKARRATTRADLETIKAKTAAAKEQASRVRAERSAEQTKQVAIALQQERLKAEAAARTAVEQTQAAYASLAEANVARLQSLWTLDEPQRKSQALAAIETTSELYDKAFNTLDVDGGALPGQFAPNDRWLKVQSALRSEAARWLTETSLQELRSFTWKCAAETTIAVSPDGQRMALIRGTTNNPYLGELQILDLTAGQTLVAASDSSQLPYNRLAISFTPAGDELLIAAVEPGERRLVERRSAADLTVKSTTPLEGFEGDRDDLQGFGAFGGKRMAFGPRGDWVVSFDGEVVYLWDLQSGKRRLDLEKTVFICFTGAGDGIVVFDPGKQALRFVAAADGQPLRPDLPYDSTLHPASGAASADGKWLALLRGSVSYDEGGQAASVDFVSLAAPSPSPLDAPAQPSSAPAASRVVRSKLAASEVMPASFAPPLRFAFHPRAPLAVALSSRQLSVLSLETGAILGKAPLRERTSYVQQAVPQFIAAADEGASLVTAVFDSATRQEIEVSLWDLSAPEVAVDRQSFAKPPDAFAPAGDGALATAATPSAFDDAALQCRGADGAQLWSKTPGERPSGFEPTGRRFVHVMNEGVEVRDSASGEIVERIARPLKLKATFPLGSSFRYIVGYPEPADSSLPQLYDASTAEWRFEVPFSESAAFSPDDRYLHWYDPEGQRIVVLETATGRRVLDLPGVFFGRRLFDRYLLVCAPRDRSVELRAFDLASGELASQFQTPFPEFVDLTTWSFDSDGRWGAITRKDGRQQNQLLVWPFADGKPGVVLETAAADVQRLLVAPDRALLSYLPQVALESSGESQPLLRRLELWSVSNKTLLREWSGSQEIEVASFDPTNRWAMIGFSGENRSATEIWHLPSGAVAATLETAALDFSPTGQYALLKDGSAIDLGGADLGEAFDAAKPALDLAKRRIRLFDEGIGYLHQYSPDGTYLASINQHVELAVRKLSGQTPAIRPSGKVFLGFSPDSRYFAVAGADPLEVWEIEAGKIVSSIAPPSSERSEVKNWAPGRVAQFSSDSQFVAFAVNNRLRLAKLGEDRTLADLPRDGHVGAVRAIVASPDGAFVAGGGDDRTVCFWRRSDGRFLGSLEGFDGPVVSLAMHPREPRLATCDSFGEITLWSMSMAGRDNNPSLAGQVLWRVYAETGDRLVFSPSGARLAIGGPGGWRCIDTATGQVTHWLRPASPMPGAPFAFDPRGDRLALASPQAIAFWDLAANEPVGEWPLGAGVVYDLAYSPSGEQLVVAGDGLRVFDDRGGLVLALAAEQSVRRLFFHGAGRWLTWLGDDREIQTLEVGKLFDKFASMGLSPQSAAPAARVAQIPPKPLWSAARRDEIDAAAAWRRHAFLAARAEANDDWSAAAEHLQALVAAAPKDASLLSRYATASAQLSRWNEAAEAYLRIVEIQPGDFNSHYFATIALLGAGDLAAWREECRRLFDRHASGPHAGQMLYAFVWAPDALADTTPLVAIAQANQWDGMKVYGLYRSGRFAEALAILARTPAESLQPWDYFFAAMAHYRIGDAEQARISLEEAGRGVERSQREIESNWVMRLGLEQLRREAEAVLAEPQPPAPEPQPPAPQPQP